MSLETEDKQMFEALSDRHNTLAATIKICSVPLRLTYPLALRLSSGFLAEDVVKENWDRLVKLGLLVELDRIPGNVPEWRLSPSTRDFFLRELESKSPKREARDLHNRALLLTQPLDEHARGEIVYPAQDQDEVRLQQAYHTAPFGAKKDGKTGADLYWKAYCRIRLSNRLTMLPVLAALAKSQEQWLVGRTDDVDLYRAVALYFEGTPERRAEAAKWLRKIIEQQPAPQILLDASFLLGAYEEATTKEEATAKREAAKLYKQGTELKQSLGLADEDADVRRHIDLTLAKCFSALANVCQLGENPREEMQEATAYYKQAIGIASKNPDYEAYEAIYLRYLVSVLQRRGLENEIKNYTARIGEIELPSRHAFEEQAKQVTDPDYRYYAISAENHGLGYECQRIQFDVHPDGGARIEGTFTLTALAVLSRINTYLQTIEDSPSRIVFDTIESLTPPFRLDFHSEGGPKARRLEIAIDPPVKPGQQLVYRWVAQADPRIFAVSADQMKAAKVDHDYIAWHVIVPMRRLEIEVSLPLDQNQPDPPTWLELWRIGQWSVTTQAQTAYRAFLEDNPRHVEWERKRKQPDRYVLSMVAHYPWLAMRYVLAWSSAG